MRSMRVLQAVIFFARFLGYGSNPLRRKWDRIEGVALATALVAAVMAVPLAMWVGSMVYDQGVRGAQVQRQSRQQTMAVLLADAPTSRLAVSRVSTASAHYWVPARWQVPDDAQCLRQPEVDPLTPRQFSRGVDIQRSGLIQVSAAAKAGSHIPVWRLIHKPPEKSGSSEPDGSSAGAGSQFLHNR